MDRTVLKGILLDQVAKPQEKIVPRTALSKIENFSKTPFIVIISGIRRCGKSTLLQEIRDDNCHYVNFDDDRLVNFTIDDFQMMHELLLEISGDKDIFIFDEIQNINGWERYARRLHDQKKKIYVSGSNASMLSKELGTHLTGRNVSIRIFPFSFVEYLSFKGMSTNLVNLTPADKSILKKAFNEYLQEGGFPEYLMTKKEEYLKSLYENVIYRDIITRYKLSSEKPIKETVYYIASNIGKELSYNTIRNLTGLSSATTIKEYLEYLENSYFAFLIPNYSPSLKEQAYSSKKVYLIDTCLARVLGFRPSEDFGRMMENMVFLSLKRKDCDIYFHKRRGECDFLVREGGKIIQAIQVTSSLNQSNRTRETEGLLDSLKEHKLKKGLIITEDQSEELEIGSKKISVVPIWRWLIENE